MYLSKVSGIFWCLGIRYQCIHGWTQYLKGKKRGKSGYKNFKGASNYILLLYSVGTCYIWSQRMVSFFLEIVNKQAARK